MHVIYDFKGESANQEAALEAVNLSQEKYCGVSQMLKKALPITWEVNYNGVMIFNNRVATLANSEN
jgi:putative redox protein